jgi:uncharacterized protein (DUF1697 family)
VSGSSKGTTGTFVAMLRGINVGNHNRMKMEALRSLVAGLGYDEPRTYLQSGNVVFSGRGRAESAATALEDAITRELGLSVPVVARSDNQLRRVVAANPMIGAGDDPTKLHVTFLGKRPGADRVRALSSSRVASRRDRFEVVGAEVFLHCPSGYGTTSYDNGFFERNLGTVATTRNWRTVCALAEMMAA